MFGTEAKPEGITDPPIDDLLEKVDSKYSLVVAAARRARQVTTYKLNTEQSWDQIGPLVAASDTEKPLTIALREIEEGKIVVAPTTD